MFGIFIWIKGKEMGQVVLTAITIILCIFVTYKYFQLKDKK